MTRKTNTWAEIHATWDAVRAEAKARGIDDQSVFSTGRVRFLRLARMQDHGRGLMKLARNCLEWATQTKPKRRPRGGKVYRFSLGEAAYSLIQARAAKRAAEDGRARPASVDVDAVVIEAFGGLTGEK